MQYGLHEVKSVQDFEHRLDKGISAMEIEANLLKERIKSLREEYATKIDQL